VGDPDGIFGTHRDGLTLASVNVLPRAVPPHSRDNARAFPIGKAGVVLRLLSPRTGWTGPSVRLKMP